MKEKVALFWFRRDLRLEDNTALIAALNSGLPVLPIFIFDREILDELEDKNDQRLIFIHETLLTIQKALVKKGSSLVARYGFPEKIFKDLLNEFDVAAVFVNHDYEPYARKRDETIANLLHAKGIRLVSFKDQVIFEKSDVVKKDGSPYSVFTPYSRAWKAKLPEVSIEPATLPRKQNFFQLPQVAVPALNQMGFSDKKTQSVPDSGLSVVSGYHRTRDIPSVAGTSRTGVHLRFGTVSVRELVQLALKENETYLGELIWREFFMQQLWHQPRLVHEACKKNYDKIRWRNNEKEYAGWCDGRTGYPLVDAGMRELNETGFMHNRVRMVAASFLVKHLLIDWRWGESYFAQKLLDYELASNNGNWQWIAGCGCDAAPYFRVFNPATQAKKFDPKSQYIRKWVPEVDSPAYPSPLVDHEFARDRCLKAYKKALYGYS